MTTLFLSPSVRHRLATVVRLVDAFTGTALRERYVVRLSGHDWWVPLFRESDATYRFVTTHRPVPALGVVNVTITPESPAPTHRDLGGLSVTIPPAGAPPVPLVVGHFLVEHPLWPTRAFRPPPGETFVKGRVIRAGQPVADQRVRVAAGAAPGPAVLAAPTDADGEFAYRLPGLSIQASTPTTVVASADLFFAVTDSGGAAQALSGPAMPVTVPMGRPATVTLDLV